MMALPVKVKLPGVAAPAGILVLCFERTRPLPEVWTPRSGKVVGYGMARVVVLERRQNSERTAESVMAMAGGPLGLPLRSR